VNFILPSIVAETTHVSLIIESLSVLSLIMIILVIIHHKVSELTANWFVLLILHFLLILTTLYLKL